MQTYSLTQWIMFFIIYCFLGWCWETPYVSIKQKKWVNRGFMHGPFLPIYGFGAIMILMATLPLRENVIYVYVAGLIAATLLEYVTGAVMEMIFKVRYWDYSYQKYNLHGYICLKSSIAWGFFSVLMVYVLHKPFEKMVLCIPDKPLVLIVDLLLVIMAADFAISFKAAIELRDLLVAVEKAKKEARILQKRLDVIEAILADEVKQKRARYEQYLEESMARVHELSKEKYENLRGGLEQLKSQYDQLEENYHEMSLETRQKLKDEMQELSLALEKAKEKIATKSVLSKDIKGLLRRHPSASSGCYRHSFREYKKDVWPDLKLELKERVDELRDNIREEMDEKKAQIEGLVAELREEIREEIEEKRKK